MIPEGWRSVSEIHLSVEAHRAYHAAIKPIARRLAALRAEVGDEIVQEQDDGVLLIGVPVRSARGDERVIAVLRVPAAHWVWLAG